MPFQPLAQRQQLHDGHSQAFEVEDLSLLLIQQQGQVFIIENRCGHFGVPLRDGTLHGLSIECPQHNIRFDLQTGRQLNKLMDACDPVRTFEVSEKDGWIGTLL